MDEVLSQLGLGFVLGIPEALSDRFFDFDFAFSILTSLVCSKSISKRFEFSMNSTMADMVKQEAR